MDRPGRDGLREHREGRRDEDQTEFELTEFERPIRIRWRALSKNGAVAGGVGRDLLGAALISLLVGLGLAVLVGSLDRSSEPDGAARALHEDRRRGPFWMLAGILIAALPAACILVSLIASGALVAVIEWLEDRIPEIRGAQSS